MFDIKTMVSEEWKTAPISCTCEVMVNEKGQR